MRYTPNFNLPFPEPADNTQTWLYWQQLAEALDLVLPTVALGYTIINVSNANSASLSITFPAGRFSKAPRVIANAHNATTWIMSTGAATTSGCTLTARYYEAGLQTSGPGCMWIAMLGNNKTDQGFMAAAAAADPDTIEIDGVTYYLRTVTCHTEDCPNAGIPLQIYIPEGSDAAACGVCGQPITDVI